MTRSDLSLLWTSAFSLPLMSCLSRHCLIFCPVLTNIIILEPQLKSACVCACVCTLSLYHCQEHRYSKVFPPVQRSLGLGRAEKSKRRHSGLLLFLVRYICLNNPFWFVKGFHMSLHIIQETNSKEKRTVFKIRAISKFFWKIKRKWLICGGN